jgi:hypothetical protein
MSIEGDMDDWWLGVAGVAVAVAMAGWQWMGGSGCLVVTVAKW